MNTRRTRIVNFRVTEEEYARLRSASRALGADGLSGYARRAVLHLADTGPGEEWSALSSDRVAESVAELRRRVSELEGKVEHLLESSRNGEKCQEQDLVSSS